jgi:tetratricopeptide (TPR) repeat protein
MRPGLSLAFFALCAACLPAAAQTNAAPDVAEAALRDGIPSLAFAEATNALASAESPEAARHAFSVAAAALERTAPPEAVLAWLDTLEDEPSDKKGSRHSSLVTRHSPPAVWFRARALSSLGRHAEAAALLAPLRASLPEGDDLAGPVLRDLAFALLSDGRPAEAAAALGPVAAGDPAATLDLARLLLATGEPERAEAILAPLAADTNAPPAVAAAAALLRLRAARDAGNRTEEHGEGAAGGTPADIRHSAFGIQHFETDVPADLRALILASRAALLAPADPAAPPPPEALGLASNALALAESPSARLDCDATLLALLARAPGGAPESLGLARRLVASSPRAPAVRAALRNAAAALLAASAPSNALAFADLHLASFADAPDEAAVLAVRAQALSALGRYGEASAAYLRAAELAAAASDAASRDEALYDAASEQHAAGLDRQAAATLDRLLAADPPPPAALRARASYLAAECLVSVDPDAASAAFLALADEFPASDEGSQAVFRAAQLADAAATNAAGIGRAIDLFRRAAAPPPSPGSAAAAETGADLPAGEEAALRIQAASALSIALLQQRQGDHSNALVSLKLAASTPDGGPAVEQALALLPAAYLALGRAEEALAAYAVFTNAHPASPWLPDLRFWRASRAFDAGEWSEAAAQFAAFAERNAASPKAPHARYYAAVALLRAQRHQEAVAAAEALAEQFPASSVLPAAAFVRAEALCQLLEFDAAALLFRGVSESPGAGPALALRASVRRADCLFALGGDAPERYAESLEAYRAALADPLCAEVGLAPECAYKAGRSLERLGRADEAARQWYDAVIHPFDAAPDPAAAPWYSRAVFDLAGVLQARGARDEAAAALRKLAGTPLPGADEAARRLAVLGE